MPTERIPLVGVPNTRNIDPVNSFTKDQIYKSVLFDVISNPQTQKKVIYANKRPGVKTGTTIDATYRAAEVEDEDGFAVMPGACTAWYNAGSPADVYIYVGTTLCGFIDTSVITAIRVAVTKAILGTEEYFLIAAANYGMYYVTASAAAAAGVTFTGDTTNGNATVANVSSFTGLVVGQLLSGTGIAAGARILSMNSGAGTLAMTINATATNSGVTITHERMSKVIDADAPTNVTGPMIEMDGYIFVAQTSTRKIYQSDINSVDSWTSTAFVTANLSAASIINDISRLKNNILAHTLDSVQFFYNAGNATGSVLSPLKESLKKLGIAQSSYSGGASFRASSYVDDIVFVVMDSVYMMTPGGIQDIADTTIKKLLNNSLRTAIAFRAFRMLGKYYFYLAEKINDGTFNAPIWQYIYDVSAGIWTQAGFTYEVYISKHLGYVLYNRVDGKWHYYPWAMPITSAAGDDAVYQDDGAAYTMMIQMAKNDHGTKRRKFASRLELVGSDVQSSGTTTVEKSDDDGASWQTLGTFDMTSVRPFITRCGSYIDRQYRLTHSANTAWRAQALEETFTVASA